MQLEQLKNPLFIQNLSYEQLLDLSEEIRHFIIDYASDNGGYLADNLSAVDISLSLYRTFDQNDVIIFDHRIDQTYKILNGKSDELSVNDRSNIFARALAAALKNRMDKSERQIILVMNDNDFSNGNNIELLNQLCSIDLKIIIVYNDDSDTDKVSLFNRIINNARNAKAYNQLKNVIKNTIKPVKYGDSIIENIHKVKDKIKKSIVNEGIFSTYDIDYIGPVDGHDIKGLNKAFELGKKKDKSCVIHCLTKSGKGYEFAENANSSLYKDIAQFDKDTGRLLIEENKVNRLALSIICDALKNNMNNDKDICILSNDPESDHVAGLFATYPDKTIMTDLNDSLKLELAIALSKESNKPYVHIDPYFLNDIHIIDQLNSLNRPLLISVSLRSNDDLRFISKINNADIWIAAKGNDIIKIVDDHFLNERLTIIIDPGFLYSCDSQASENLGKWHFCVNNDMKDVAIFAYGRDLTFIEKLIRENELNYSLIDCSMINGYDDVILSRIANDFGRYYFYGELFSYLDIDNDKIIKDMNVKELFEKIEGDINA